MKKENNQEKKLTLREKLKDKREKAKLELMLYGIFFIGIIIFSRVISSTNTSTENINNNIEKSFIESIDDNYEYNLQITINNKKYKYYGKVLGNNSTINLEEESKTTSYYLMNKKYYILENENYMLVDEKEVYPYLEYRYLNLNTIKEYIRIATKEENNYKVKLSDIILNSEGEDYLIITINEEGKSLTIDYTPLFELTEQEADKVVVNISYSNIDKIISLEE